MLEWNQFVKPVMYVLELIFGIVVTFGTADKLLYISGGGAMRCVLGNSLGACVSVIILGSIALLIHTLVFWRRVVSAFDDAVSFSNGDEAAALACIAVLWVLVSAVFTGKQFWWRPPPGARDRLIGERYVMLVFCWLLCILTAFSAAIAWFVPDRDTPGDPAGPLLAAAAADLHPFARAADSEPSDPGASDCSTAGDSTRSGSADEVEGEEPGASLVRLNAARPSSLRSDRRTPDVSVINAKLSAWEEVLAGPREDPHAAALAAAIRFPLPAAGPARDGSGSARSGQPLRRDGLRRRAVHFPVPGDRGAPPS